MKTTTETETKTVCVSLSRRLKKSKRVANIGVEKEYVGGDFSGSS